MKRSELEEAIRYVLGQRVHDALVKAGVRLPEQIKMASLEAFRKGWSYSTDTVGSLREALSMLEKPGWLTFEEETPDAK